MCYRQKNLSLIFETEHGLRGPCNNVHGGARFSEKDFVSKIGNTGKKELKMGFFGFIENLIIFF